MCGLAYRAHIHQGAGQERADALDVDGETALDLAVDDAVNHLVGCVCRFEVFPRLGALGFLTGQLGLAETVFHGFEGNLDFITDGQGALTRGIGELGTRNDAFGLQARVDGHPLVIDVDHHAGNDGTGLHVDSFQTFFKKFSERFAHYTLPVDNSGSIAYLTGCPAHPGQFILAGTAASAGKPGRSDRLIAISTKLRDVTAWTGLVRSRQASPFRTPQGSGWRCCRRQWHPLRGPVVTRHGCCRGRRVPLCP